LGGLFSVGNTDKRKQTYSTKTLSGEGEMAQAKTLTQAEVDQVLRYVSTMRYKTRNRMMVLTSFWSGMRVGEIAALRICDVRNDDGTIKQEVRLAAEQTKGKHPRTVFLNEKLRTELKTYVSSFGKKDAKSPLFFTEKRDGFDANTLAQWFHWLYKKAGISGASSHSGRRTFITSLAGKGVGVRVLASLAGHRSISVTQAYIDVNDDMKRHAVELV
jgi:integrase/recombinase XerD